MNVCYFTGTVKESQFEAHSTRNSHFVKFTIIDKMEKATTYITCVAWGDVADDLLKYNARGNVAGLFLMVECKYSVSASERDGKKQYFNNFVVTRIINDLSFAPGSNASSEVKRESEELKEDVVTYTPPADMNISDEDLPF